MGHSVVIGKSQYSVSLKKINLKKQAKVSIIPEIKNTETEANFSFKIGIEKRSIKLSPEQIKNKVENINKSLRQWEKISNNLRTTVQGFKAACLGTGTYLTIKNFFDGVGGKAEARHTVTETYRDIVCKDEIREKDEKGY